MPNVLPDISDVEPLSEHDRGCLEELRTVLARHGALDRFGVNLLHDHFSLDDDEILVETCDPGARTLTMRPGRSAPARPGDSLVETSWRFTDGGTAGPRTVCRVGCFVDLQTRHRRTHDRVWER